MAVLKEPLENGKELRREDFERSRRARAAKRRGHQTCGSCGSADPNGDRWSADAMARSQRGLPHALRPARDWLPARSKKSRISRAKLPKQMKERGLQKQDAQQEAAVQKETAEKSAAGLRREQQDANHQLLDNGVYKGLRRMKLFRDSRLKKSHAPKKAQASSRWTMQEIALTPQRQLPRALRHVRDQRYSWCRLSATSSNWVPAELRSAIKELRQQKHDDEEAARKEKEEAEARAERLLRNGQDSDFEHQAYLCELWEASHPLLDQGVFKDLRRINFDRYHKLKKGCHAHRGRHAVPRAVERMLARRGRRRRSQPLRLLRDRQHRGLRTPAVDCEEDL